MTPFTGESASNRGRTYPGAVFLLFACLYILSIGRGFYSSDGDVMFKTTVALVEHQSFVLEPDPGLPQIVRGHDHRYYSKYDPGLPLLLAPFYVTGDWIAQVNHAHRYGLAAMFVLLVPALAGAGTLAALSALIEQLSSPTTPRIAAYPGPLMALPRHSQAVHGLVILAAGLASPLWVYARVLFAEAVLTFALTMAVVILFRERDSRHGAVRLTAAGIIFGAGILTRAALVIYLPALMWLIIRQCSSHSRRAIVARLALFGMGVLPFVAGLGASNTLRFGDLSRFGYAGEGFTTPPWDGIAGLLFSPGKSLFLYAPPLVLSVILWPRFRRAHPALGEFLALAWASSLIFYGAWWAWHGGWSWGPRFLVPLIPLGCVPLIVLPTEWRWRAALAALILSSGLIQGAGVLTDLTPHYAALTVDGKTDYAALHNDLSHVPQAAALRRVLHGKTEPLAVFHLQRTGLPPTWTVGIPALLLAGVVSAGVLLSKPRISRTGRPAK